MPNVESMHQGSSHPTCNPPKKQPFDRQGTVDDFSRNTTYRLTRDCQVLHISVLKNTMNPSKDDVDSLIVLPRPSEASYVREHILTQMELPKDHSDLAYRLSNETSRTRHSLSNDNDMYHALLSLERAIESARSIQLSLHVYNTVCGLNSDSRTLNFTHLSDRLHHRNLQRRSDKSKPQKRNARNQVKW